MRKALTVGVLAESKNIWERRAPLTPQDVKWLVQRKIKVEVMTSPLRIFRDSDYKRAGAKVVSCFKHAKLLVGVKEPSPSSFRRKSVYLVFSHTAKGQSTNRLLVKAALKQHITLIDYEHILDTHGQRLVYFGRFAGICGMIDSLHYLGKRYQALGIKTPLLYIRRSLDYETFKKAKRHLSLVARQIRRRGFPHQVAPFVVGITGHGNVSKGVQEVLKIFHPLEIHPRDMMCFIRHQRKFNKQIYKIIFHREEKFRSKKKKGFYFEDYLANPKQFESNLDQYLPHINLLMNTSYWDKRYPKLVSEKMIRRMVRKGKESRLRFIGDLSCDVSGTIEITKKTTTPGKPVFLYNPSTGRVQDGYEGKGLSVLAVDNLPCEFPQDSSEEFSELIRDYVYQLAAHGATDVTEHVALPREIRNAVITQGGRFTKTFRYMRHMK